MSTLKNKKSRIERYKEWFLDGGVLFICTFCMALSIGALNGLSILIFEFLHYFRESKFITSWAHGIPLAMDLAVAPVWMFVMTKLTHRQMITIGLLFTSLGLFLSSFATSIYHLYLCLGFISGIGFGMLNFTSLIYANEYFKRRRYLAVGLVSAGAGIGSTIAPPYLKLLINRYTWRGALMILSATAAQFIVFTPVIQNLSKKEAKVLEELQIPQNSKTYKSFSGDKPCDKIPNYGYPLYLIEGMLKNNKRMSIDDDLEFEFDLQSPSLTDNSQNNQPDEMKRDSETEINHTGEFDEFAERPRFELTLTTSEDNLETMDSNNFTGKRDSTTLTDKSFLIFDSLNNSVSGLQNVNSYDNKGQGAIAEQYEYQSIQKCRTDPIPLDENNQNQLRYAQSNGHICKSKDDTEAKPTRYARRYSTYSYFIPDYCALKKANPTKQETVKTPSQVPNITKIIMENRLIFKTLASPLQNVRLLLTNWKFYMLAGNMYLTVFALAIFTTFNMDYFHLSGIEEGHSLLLVTLSGVGNLAGRLTTAILAQVFHSHRAVLPITANAVFILSCVLISQYVNFHLYAALSFIIGFTYGVAAASAPIVALEFFGVSRLREGFSMILTFYGTGALTGPPVGGYVFDETQDYVAVFLMSALITIVALILLSTVFFWTLFAPVGCGNLECFSKCREFRRTR